MSIQNFFYIVTSAAIILLTLLFVVLIIIGIIITVRLAKTFRHLHQASENINQTTKKLKEKIKLSTFISLLEEGIKEFILLLKKPNQPRKKKK